MKWLIKKYMAEQHIDSLDELSKATGISRRTLFYRISDPRTIKVFEIEALDKVLHFADEDIVKLAKGEI